MPDSSNPSSSPAPDGRSATAGWEIVACCLLVLIAAGLQWQAITKHSLTGDGALHLLAGHQALRYGENLLNWEHPPLVKLVMGVPAALASEPLLEPTDAEQSLDAIARAHLHPNRLFRAMIQGRVLVFILLALPALYLCFRLAALEAPTRAGWILVGLMTLSFSILPFYTILQTDVGALLGYVGTCFGCIRLLQRPTPAHAALTGLLWGVGLASKYSTILLAPTVAAVLLILIARAPRTARVRRAAWATAAVAVGALVAPVASYAVANRNLVAASQARILDQYVENRATLVVDDRLQPYRPHLEALGEVSDSLSQYALGFLGIRIQNQVGIYSSYLFGEISSRGRLAYFPALTAAKLPILLLLTLLLTGRAQWQAWNRLDRDTRWVVSLTVGVYVVVALSSSYNIGFRHLLPILPLVLLPVSRALARRPRIAGALLALLALESIAVAPQWIASTNTWWLGDRNPTRTAFSDGNLEYAQNFFALAEAVPADEPVGVLYPGKDTRILSAYAPNLYAVAPGTVDLEPGLYAVSVLIEQYVPGMKAADPERVHRYEGLHALALESERTWEEMRAGTDLGRVAGTFRLYRIEAPTP